jgi:hypothetical protein
LSGPSIHAWVQFRLAILAFFGVGADNIVRLWTSLFTMDGYMTPAVPFLHQLGCRIKTN